MDLEVANAHQALKLCLELVQERRADLFRGQSRDWPKLLPSLLRPGINLEASRAELAEFLEWSQSVPQMASYRGSKRGLTAIAQHYGVPTRYLDLTEDPRVALLFSKPAPSAVAPAHSVIYCFSESQLSSFPDVEVIRIEVANLWRLQAQNGLFLNFKESDTVRDLKKEAIKIHFPAEPITVEETAILYPTRKSPLELVIDQWIYRHGVEELFSKVAVKKRIAVRRYTYPGAFRWRAAPDLTPKWFQEDPRWIFHVHEDFISGNEIFLIELSKATLRDPHSAVANIATQIRDVIGRRHLSGQQLSFAVRLPTSSEKYTSSISTILNRCWDGLRNLPFTCEEVLTSLARVLAFIFARAERVKAVDRWPEKLWGRCELLDIAPVGGHLEIGIVSRVSLDRCLRNTRVRELTNHFQLLAEKDPYQLMAYVVDPWLLFNFESWRSLFVQEFIPTAIDSFWREDLEHHKGALGCFWSITFNPVLLGFVTNGLYRFRSPCALQTAIEQVIIIFQDMDRDAIEEVFISCVPYVLMPSSQPFRVQFHGYSNDPRGLWEIERVVEQAGWIVDVAGISVLKVTTTLDALRDDDDYQSVDLGAFEIWLIARRHVKAFTNRQANELVSLYEEFWPLLGLANEQIERRAQSMPDWPGPLESD